MGMGRRLGKGVPERSLFRAPIAAKVVKGRRGSLSSSAFRAHWLNQGNNKKGSIEKPEGGQGADQFFEVIKTGNEEFGATSQWWSIKK